MTPLDDNTAHLETTAYIAWKGDELYALADLFFATDPRPEPGGSPWRHTPAFPEARNTVCEICNLQLHEQYESPSGWRIWQPGDF